MKTPKIKQLVIGIYVLSFPAAYFIAETFGRADRFGSKSKTLMPMVIGLFCLTPFVLLSGSILRNAPASSRGLLAIHAAVLGLVLNPGTTDFAMLLPIPLFFVTLYFSKREARRDYEGWLRAKNFAPVNPPETVFNRLDRQIAWRCYAGALALANGRTIPLVLWEGIGTTSSMPGGGGAPTRTKFGLVAFSLPAAEAGDAFMREMDASSLSKLSFWQRMKPSNQTSRPFIAEELPDGTFVVGWTTLHVAWQMEEQLQSLRTLLETTSASSMSPR